MGKRCRQAASGATFALLVAACAATDAPSSREQPSASPRTAITSTTLPTTVTFPDSLADASFVQAAMPDGPCAAGDNAQVTLFNIIDGSETWAFPLPRPGRATAVHGSAAYVSLRWDRGQLPGIAAIDLDAKAPQWQRFLPSEPESVQVAPVGLIVVTADDVRALDSETGEDLWVTSSQFDFTDVVLTDDAAYAIDSVGVSAISYDTGQVLWQLPIERPDALATDGTTLAVAANNRLIAVDIDARTKLWDTSVSRLGAGEIFVTPTSVAFELTPSVAPGGGIAVLDRVSGFELWRASGVGEPRWIGNDQLIASTANAEPTPGQPYVLFALDAASGQELWRTPSTAQAFDSIVGSAPGQVVVVDPHPAIAGLQRIRLLDSLSGLTTWESATEGSFDSAAVDSGSVVTLFGSNSSLGADRGSVALVRSGGDSWMATRADGIASAPQITPHGLLVVSGERTPTCVSRSVGSPRDAQSAVLGATVESD